MMIQNDWANWQATQRHYELFARHVIPYFQPSQRRLLNAEKFARDNWNDLNTKQGTAIQNAIDAYKPRA